MRGMRKIRNAIVMSVAGVSFVSGCTQMRLRTPSPEEKRHYLISKNLDEALIDRNEKGPLNLVDVLASDGAQTPDSPIAFAMQQKSLIASDIQLASYTDEESEEMPALTAEEKGSSILIGTIIVIGVIVGATIPILYLLHVF